MRPTVPTLLLALALPTMPAHAAESYDNCVGFIDSVPAVVSTQGLWCLRKDLSTALNSGAVIDINANNVTIDCNGFKLGGLAAGPTSQAVAISTYGRSNVVVRDCLIRGFKQGINLYNTSGGLVEDVVTEGIYSSAIVIYGDNCMIRRNRVIDTGSSATNGFATGIYGSCDILENTVAGVEEGNARGIVVQYGSGLTVQGNHIRGVAGATTSRGILADYSLGAVMRDNHVRGSGSFGIVCTGSDAVALGNVVGGFITGVHMDCEDAGNVILP